MKSKFLGLGMVMAVMVGMIACNKGIENNDEQKAIENDQAIQKYIADSAMTATRDSSGMYYRIRKANPTGAKPKPQEAVRLNFTGYTLDGRKVLSSENTEKIPFVRPYGMGFLLRGMERALNIMRVGESITIFMPFYLAYGSYSLDGIPAYSVIKMNMELLSSRTEVQQIDDYLEEKKYIPSERSADDLIIIRTNTVTGDTIGSGKSVNVKYKGSLLTGFVFDKGEKSLSYTTGSSSVVKGFDRAVRRMRKGEKAIVIFPSTLGYGKDGRAGSDGIYGVFPYSPLQFEMEVL